MRVLYSSNELHDAIATVLSDPKPGDRRTALVAYVGGKRTLRRGFDGFSDVERYDGRGSASTVARSKPKDTEPRAVHLLVNPFRTSNRYGLETAVFVPPPCCVTRGLQRTLTAPWVKDSSVALLDQMNASPGRRFDIFSGVSEPRAALAF